MSIDYNAITAWAAVAAAITAIIAIRAESKRSRFALGVDLIIKLDERFNSEEMQKARQDAAKSLLDKTYTGADDMLDFFEMIGLLTRRGALDEKMVWHTFFYWLHRYWCSANEYITKERREDFTVWADLNYLHSRVVDIEKRERRCTDSDLLLSEDSIKEFLEEESNLRIDVNRHIP